MRFPLTILLAALWTSTAIAQPLVSLADSPLEPAATGGLQVVDRALVKLSSHRRLLVVGAHPDDEDTTLLAFVGTGLGGEAAYLSLSRGEGGQNLIGTELGTGLGLIRTGELMAARRIEGTHQFFTRAYDFGYTRSLTETFDRWPRAVLLEDAVRAVRRFKPQVVVAVFPGNGRAGHGQHQASGVIAEEVFEVAGEPDRFPELTAAGLPPWQPRALYRRVWRGREEASLEFPLDQIDPFSGRSVLQTAGASRSMHRSQDMGTLQRLGSRQGGLIWVAGEAALAADEVFGGIDTSLAAIAELLPAGPLRDQVHEQLEGVATLAEDSRAVLSPSQMAAVVPALARISDGLGASLAAVTNAGGDARYAAATDLLSEKRQVASLALAAAAGVAVDAVADRETVAIGESLVVTATVWDSGDRSVDVEAVRIESRDGWQVSSQTRAEGDEGISGLEQWEFEIRVPETGTPTVPYFLERPLNADLYDWDEADPRALGEPWQRAPAVVVFDLRIAGAPVSIEREVVHRVRDQARGEVRLPIRALPEIEVAMTPGLLLWSAEGDPRREIEVRVRSHSQGSVAGLLELAASDATWPLPAAREFQIDEPGGQKILRIELESPAKTVSGRIEWAATARMKDGAGYDSAYPVISHPHIRPLTLPVPARLDIQMLDLKLPNVSRIGYVRGASDRVPEILEEIGLPIQMLTAGDLRAAELSRFDAIVVGSRAYETNPVLSEINSRLLEYVEDGGLLVVQYQQYQFVRGEFAPLQLEISRPHGRVTDETARVDVLRPEHPIFEVPNRITAEDWDGWVQERGLYFASEWDPAFTPLLSLQDEGQPAERGALLVANVGKGIYVYSGLSFFRQLPAGVPGAIRLFVNLLSMERS